MISKFPHHFGRQIQGLARIEELWLQTEIPFCLLLFFGLGESKQMLNLRILEQPEEKRPHLELVIY